MGWNDRDYSQETWTDRGGGPVSFRWPSRVAGVLVALHVVAFVLLRALPGGEEAVGKLVLQGPAVQPLAVLTHPLATTGVLTLLVTIVGVWWLGTRIEEESGRVRLLSLYVAGNVLAGLAFYAVASLRPALAGAELDYPGGAFVAWMVVFFRRHAGEMMPVFGRLRPARQVVMIAVAIVAGLMFLFGGPAVIARLVALAVGGLAEPLVRRVPLPIGRTGWQHRPRVRPSIPREPILPEPPPPEPESGDEPAIDDILAKISSSGLASLTDEERARLEAARRAKLRSSSGARTGS